MIEYSGRGRTQSPWMPTPTARREPLGGDLDADVCVVGAGIAGLTTAYELAKQGKRVVVLEMGTVGFGTTSGTTAHLSNALDDRYMEVERLRGRETARLAAQSHTAAIDRIETLQREAKIDCAFERLDGFLVLAEGQPRRTLEDELAAAQRAGLAEVELLSATPAAAFEDAPCLRFPRQGQFDPIRYLEGLAEAFEREGGTLHTGTRVVRASGGTRTRVRTESGHVVRAGSLVLATHLPLNSNSILYSQLPPHRSYVIAATVDPGAVPKALYWDTLDPYHYVRLAEADGRTLLIVGGEDHHQATAPEGPQFDKLEGWTRERFPIQDVVHRWSAMTYESMDGLGYIGRAPLQRNVYIATGDSGMGMTHGTIAGMLLPDLIAGRENRWADAYAPSRGVPSLKQFAKHNLHAAKSFLQWVQGGEVGSVAEVPPGQGAIVRRGVQKLAVYCDPQGKAHAVNAMCTHRGCVVQWNAAETSWDCPCHGSSFDPQGRLLHGPATSDLLKARVPQATRRPSARPKAASRPPTRRRSAKRRTAAPRARAR